MVKRKDQLKALLSGTMEPTLTKNTDVRRAPKIKSTNVSAGARNPRAVDEAGEMPGKGTPKAAEPGKDGRSAQGPGDEVRSHTASGAVRAVGLSLGSLTRDAQSARQLRDELAVADRVVSLDPSMIEPAPIADRMAGGGLSDDGMESLKRSIEQDGQAVPVLVRPHSDPIKAQNGLYQTAYGHRRIAAATALGRKVKAVVRIMSDVELVLAQGKENAERRDLSYIERALFAFRMVQRGFDRTTAQAALGIDKTEMSRLIAVAESVPSFVALAIGPAPKAGRQRWMEIGEEMRSAAGHATAVDEIYSKSFQSLASDERFRLLHGRLTARRTRAARKPRGPAEECVLKTADGEIFAVLHGAAKAKARGKVSIALTGPGATGFASFLSERLPDLHAAYHATVDATDSPSRSPGAATGTSGGDDAT